MTPAGFSESSATASADTVTPPRARPKRINPWRLFTGSMVPNWLLSRPEISQGAKLAYARLAQYAGREGRAFPKQDTLADELGVCARMVRDYLAELAQYGLVESEQHGLGTSNSYHFLEHPWIAEGQPGDGAIAASDRQSSSASDRKNSSGPDRQSSSTPTKEENQVKERSTQAPRAPASGLPRSEAEAVEQAALVGIPPDFARVEFCRLESVGWVNGAGNPVHKWVHHLRKRWADDQSQRAERQTRATSRPGRVGGFVPPRKFSPADYQQTGGL